MLFTYESNRTTRNTSHTRLDIGLPIFAPTPASSSQWNKLFCSTCAFFCTDKFSNKNTLRPTNFNQKNHFLSVDSWLLYIHPLYVNVQCDNESETSFVWGERKQLSRDTTYSNGTPLRSLVAITPLQGQTTHQNYKQLTDGKQLITDANALTVLKVM